MAKSTSVERSSSYSSRDNTTPTDPPKCSNNDDHHDERPLTTDCQPPASTLTTREESETSPPTDTTTTPTSSSSFFYRLLWIPTGQSGLKVGALLRIGFSLIVLYDRFIMTFHLKWFFDPDVGMLQPPFSALSKLLRLMENNDSDDDNDDDNHDETFSLRQQLLQSDDGNDDDSSIPTRLPITSVFRYFGPEWDYRLVNVLHFGSMVFAIFLLLGIMPRLMAFGVHISIVSFRNRSINMIYDLQDTLMLLMSFYMLFLPLHHWSVAITPSSSSSSNSNSSWPIWPFRLIQWQITNVFTGAGLGKLSYGIWRDGWAMYNVIHQQDFFGGLVCPDWFFNRMGTLWILTYISLIIECTCWIFVWPTASRNFVVVTMVLFHLGIDLSMNIHVFHWLSILAWCSFLVEPKTTTAAATTTTTDDSKNKNHHQQRQRTFTNKGGPKTDNVVDENSTNKMHHSFTSALRIKPFLRRTKHALVDTVFPLLWLVILIVQTAPVYDMYRLTASWTYQQQKAWPIRMMSKVVELQDSISDWVSPLLLQPLSLHHQTVWNMYSAPSRGNNRITAKISFIGNGDKDDRSSSSSINDTSNVHGDDSDGDDNTIYWVSTEWTKLSVIEKKLMYRHVLFWNSIRFEPLVQHRLCQYLAQRYGSVTTQIETIVLNKVTVKAPPYYTIRKTSSFMDPARQSRLVHLVEEVLYIYEPGVASPGEGFFSNIDEDDEEDGDDYIFGYVWDDVFDGIWWDGIFYEHVYGTVDTFVLSEYPQDHEGGESTNDCVQDVLRSDDDNKVSYTSEGEL